MNKRLVELSKFMALTLRHRAKKVGISLDEHGWANVSELIVGIHILKALEKFQKLLHQDFWKM